MRNVLITGAAGSLGAAIAKRFRASGDRPLLLDRQPDALERAAVDIGVPAEQVHCLDITNEGAVRDTMSRLSAEFGPMDVLVNNAGISQPGAVAELPSDSWRRVLEVNLTGTYLCSKYAMPHLRPGTGCIVHMCSVLGLRGKGMHPSAAYHASKGGIVNLTRSMAVECAPAGIRVNAVAPGWVRSVLARGFLDDPKLLARILDATPLREVARPEDVAGAVAFLCSPDARMITGHVLPVDGGFMAQ